MTEKTMTKTNASSVFRVNRTGNFTTMGNYHLRSKNLSLKAVGLLSKVLSLPDDWSYSVSGLTAICKESRTAVRSALRELQDYGYLKITRLLPNETESRRIEYVYDFYEYSRLDDFENSDESLGKIIQKSVQKNVEKNVERKPQKNVKKNGVSTKKVENSKKITPQDTGSQDSENLLLEKENFENQISQNRTQSNTNHQKLKNKRLNDEISINQSASQQKKFAAPPAQDGLTDEYSREIKAYLDIIKRNIGYEDYVLEFNPYISRGELDEIVGIIVRAVCSRKPAENICGESFPREVVRSALLKADIDCIERALERMKETDNVRNFEKYFLSTLFNEINNHRFYENAEQRNAEFAVRRDWGYPSRG